MQNLVALPQVEVEMISSEHSSCCFFSSGAKNTQAAGSPEHKGLMHAYTHMFAVIYSVRLNGYLFHGGGGGLGLLFFSFFFHSGGPLGPLLWNPRSNDAGAYRHTTDSVFDWSMLVLPTEFYTVIPLLMTLIVFQCHSSLKHCFNQKVYVLIGLSSNFLYLLITSCRSWTYN